MHLHFLILSLHRDFHKYHYALYWYMLYIFCWIDFIAHIFSVFIDIDFSGSGFIWLEFNIVWDYRSALLVLFSLIKFLGDSPESIQVAAVLFDPSSISLVLTLSSFFLSYSFNPKTKSCERRDTRYKSQGTVVSHEHCSVHWKRLWAQYSRQRISHSWPCSFWGKFSFEVKEDNGRQWYYLITVQSCSYLKYF